jgi:23S rRNA (guanosine2251-2'-O)-methyltransferase
MSRVVYGLRPVEELLRARRGEIAAVYFADGDRTPMVVALAALAKAHGVHAEVRARSEIEALAPGAVHQGVVAVVGDFQYVELSDLLAPRDEPPLILVLDGIQDPHNLGALVRSAHVLGAHGVVIPRDRAAQVTPAVVKASAGATEHTPIARVTNITRALEELKEAGLWIVGAVADGGDDPWRIDLTGAIAVVLGAEGSGVRPLVARTCDLRVRIPMAGQVASLNVSAAGAVLLYEATRQRRSSGGMLPPP